MENYDSDQDSKEWPAVVRTVMEFRAPQNSENFLTGSSSQNVLCSVDLIKSSKVISNGCYSVITCGTE